MTMSEEPDLEHLRWLIDSRGQNNVSALKLLALFRKHQKKLSKHNHAVSAQHLVAIAFSLWRAAFLTDTKGDGGIGDAQKFLQKILVDNAITFAQDREWREWSVNYYIGDARLRLKELEKNWKNEGVTFGSLYPPDGEDHAKGRWDLTHKAFDNAVNHFSKQLEKIK